MLISPHRRASSRHRLLLNRSAALFLLLLLGATVGHAQSSTIAYAQGNYSDPQTPLTTVTVSYLAAQTAGNLNVVVIGWNDSMAHVQTVADTKGNIYSLAVGPTVQTGVATQAIYYAKNISSAAANANTVTVTFNVAANFSDIRIAEYTGLDPVNPLDVAATAAGSGATSSSGAIATTNANDLLVGADLVQTATTGPGTGYTRRLISNPDSDILEDRVVTGIASYSATAPVSPSGAWIMQMVAFRATNTPPPPDTQPPTAPANLTASAVSASQINLSWTASTDNVGVTRYLVERCLGSGCANFAQIATPTGTTLNDTALTSGTTYNYRVRATDAANNLSGYSNIANATTQTPDTQPPTAPANLTASAVSASQINLSWTASTDNVAVTGYLVERCQGTGCINFAQIGSTAATTYNDPGLAPSTNYNYRVRATDAASNLSLYSNTASATTQASAAAISFVQSNYATPLASQTTVTVAYTAAQAAGDTNVVVVGWNDTTSTVQSVIDNKGNTYVLAVGPMLQVGVASQSIYYATNIAASAANTNSVTVTFTPAARFPDIRIAEYSGIDPAFPVDGVAADRGTNGSSNSGLLTTKNTFDVLVGANLVQTGTTAAGTGYVNRVTTVPDGDILEDRVVTTIGSYDASATLSSPGVWIMQMVAFRAAGSPPPPPPDKTPPTVLITAPSNGATVSGTITLSANASDNVSVLGLQFQVDGVNVGTVVKTSPYSISFDTTLIANGTHAISAYAWDPNKNFGHSAPVSVTSSNANPSNPAQLGLWSGTINWPLVAIHSNVLATGAVLMWDQLGFGLNDPMLWDPATSSFTSVPTNDGANIFCSGTAPLGDGRIVAAGGHVTNHTGLPLAHLFDPATSTWSSLPNMNFTRWYPTATTLPNGRVLVTSGEISCAGCDVLIPEIYNPATNTWTNLTNASLTLPYYPHMYVLPDGRIAEVGSSESPVATMVLDTNAQTWTTVDSRLLDAGSSVMYLPGKFVKSGTSRLPDLTTQPSVSSTYVLDMTQSNPSWRQVASMAFPRAFHNMTILPDGTVLVTGGGTTSDAIGLANSVFPAELWSPTSETWTTLSSMHSGRLYHSTAVLLPDGRVLIAGGGRFFSGPDPTDQLSAEIFAPPYLFKGPRPTITSAPAQLTYGQNFAVQTPDASRVANVVLIRLSDVTHAINMNQRYLPLTFSAAAGSLTATAPANPNLAPPGYYMLFLVDTNGVPSVASIVNFPVTTGATQPPTAPANLSATGGVGSVSLNWSASSGPSGVGSYSVYRAAAPGVVPSTSNLIAQPTGTSYVDTNFPVSGTYYYVVTARDPLGNESAPSNETVGTVSADTTPPTDPSNLVATAVSNSQINLSWTASTDNVGVTGYSVVRCQGVSCANFAQVAAPTGTAFSDNGLAASTSHSYRVRATDAAGNLSGYSNVASATTAATPPQVATPTFVQVNSAIPQSSSVASVSVTFTAAQTAGNLNVVVVGWNDATAAVNSVTDTSGNVYTRAVGPTPGSALSQSIYSAKNIVPAGAGVNRVTVAFSPSANAPDIRILEYSGIDPVNPVDTAVAAVGNSAMSDSGAAATTNANDLLFAANMVFTTTTGPGTGFTSRIITSPDGDVAEDRVVTSTGSYNATALLGPSGSWVMQLVAFRAAGSPPPLALAIEGPPAP